MFPKQAADAAIAGCAGLPVEYADLTFHSNRGAGDQWHPLLTTEPVKLLTHCNVVGAVKHHLLPGDQRQQRCIVQLSINRMQLAVRIDGGQALCGGVHFGAANISIVMQELPLQVGVRHGIEVEQRQATDTGSRQIGRSRAAESAQPHDQRMTCFQPLLTVEIKAAQYNLPVVAQHLLIA